MKNTIVLASHNQGKLKELVSTFEAHKDFSKVAPNVNFKLAKDYNLESPFEGGTTFEENALLKAKYVGEATGEIAIADDSGLCILALENQPGVYSANWIESLGLQGAIAKILEFLKDKPNKQAKFVSTICVYYPKTKAHEFFIGEIKGEIIEAPKGHNGFGYDPIFLPKGFDKTFGEMKPEEKNAISHRTIALNKCIDKLLKELI